MNGSLFINPKETLYTAHLYEKLTEVSDLVDLAECQHRFRRRIALQLTLTNGHIAFRMQIIFI